MDIRVTAGVFVIAAAVVFIIAALPVFAAIFSRLFLGEPISRRMVVTMAAVVPGLVTTAIAVSKLVGGPP